MSSATPKFISEAAKWSSYGSTYSTPASFFSAVPSYFSHLASSWLLEDLNQDAPIKFLDVAAGPGTLAQGMFDQLSKRNLKLPAESAFYITDYAPGMVEAAKKRFGNIDKEQFGLTNLEFHVMDACNPDVTVIPVHSISHLGCMFGIMFFPERLQALQKLHDLLLPNAKVVFTSFSNSDFAHLANDLCDFVTNGKHRLEDPLATLNCKDPVELQHELESTGYHHVHVFPHEKCFFLPIEGDHVDHLFNGLVNNPSIQELLPILHEMNQEELKQKFNDFIYTDNNLIKKWLVTEGEEMNGEIATKERIAAQKILKMKWNANIATCLA